MRTANCLSGCFVNWGTDRSDEHKQTGCTDILSVCPPVDFFLCSIGIYSIVDGYFIGNRLGDAGLSAVTIVYPIVAFIQAVGTGLGMGGAIYFSIERARGQDKEANRLIAIANWLMLGFSVLLTTLVLFYNAPMLKLLGASGNMLPLAQEYIIIISFGTGLQIFGTGLVPFIRNLGGSSFAMISMVSGFATNIVFDYLFVWVREQGMTGAALATVLGQGLTMLFALAYLFRKGRFTMKIHLDQVLPATSSVVRVGLAPFGLAMSPNISLMIINRFSASYGGESAIAVYACIAYMISIISLILQGIGDGSQPLISRFYGEDNHRQLRSTQGLAYGFSLLLAFASCLILYVSRSQIGILFGTSVEVNQEVSAILPIFLVSVPFVAISRITTSGFYASQRVVLSYLLIFIEPVLMLVFMLILPPLFGGQIMIWWCTVFARILCAVLACGMAVSVKKRYLMEGKQYENSTNPKCNLKNPV